MNKRKETFQEQRSKKSPRGGCPGRGIAHAFNRRPGGGKRKNKVPNRKERSELMGRITAGAKIVHGEGLDAKKGGTKKGQAEKKIKLTLEN